MGGIPTQPELFPGTAWIEDMLEDDVWARARKKQEALRYLLHPEAQIRTEYADEDRIIVEVTLPC